MLRNYFRTALRIIWKNKTFSAVNIIGFSIGLASCLLILLYVNNEISYERMHKNRNRIYRIPVNLTSGDAKIPFASAMPPLAPTLLEESPEVLEAVRIRAREGVSFESDGRTFLENNFVYTEPSFFDIFSFELLHGDKSTVLKEPYTIIISEDIRKKYFGNMYPVGKTLEDQDGTIYTITGVMKDPTSNTQLDFDFLASYQTIDALGQYIDHWGQFGTDHTFILVNESFNISDFEKRLKEIVDKYNNPAMASMISLFAQPFKDIYFKSHLNSEFDPQGNLQQVYLFSVVAFLIMLIACLNFMNLSTARSSQRMKEVGMRKIFGSGRTNLVRQFLSESILITIISMGLALLIFRLLYPALNNFIGKELTINYLINPITLLVLLILAIIVGFLSGLYPAIFISRYAPLSAIRAKGGKTSTALRKIMVIIQFTIAIVLIIITSFVFKQLHFVKNEDLGFDKDNIMILDLQGINPDKMRSFEVQIMQIPGIEMTSKCFTHPCSRGAMVVNAVSSSDEEGQSRDGMMINVLPCDENYIPLFGLELVDGRNFSPDIVTDVENAIILNESAVKEFGLVNPIGADMGLPLNTNQESNSIIVGVLKDFHYRSLRDKIAPVALFMSDTYSSTLVVKYDPYNFSHTLKAIQANWKINFPDTPFEYSFLEDVYNMLYRSEEKMGKLFIFFSLLIIFVACLGIFGLTSFISEQRTREIGIRKVLGSSSFGVIELLTKDFIKWVIIANIIAIPIAWYISDKWMQKFAYRTSLSVWIFLFAGFLTLIISLLTISIQTYRAANLDPVETIKYE